MANGKSWLTCQSRTFFTSTSCRVESSKCLCPGSRVAKGAAERFFSGESVWHRSPTEDAQRLWILARKSALAGRLVERDSPPSRQLHPHSANGRYGKQSLK